MLHVNSLVFDYMDKPLLKNVQFSLSNGMLLHLRGGNGAGKTTLLKLLAGLLHPHSGQICWGDNSIHENLPAYQRELCYVGHKSGLSPQLTVKENCVFDLQWANLADNLIDELLQRFGLQTIADTPCYQLSAGQRRRVALLRITMTRKRLWLLDEPLVALDTAAILALTTCLEAQLAANGIIIMTSHQPLPAQLSRYQEYTL